MTRPHIPSHFDMGAHAPTPGNKQPFAHPTRTPRLLLAQRSDRPTPIDGVWSPWTTNLTNELHDLATALTVRLGPISRVAFDWNAVSSSQRRIDEADGIRVTGPVPDQPANVMYVFGQNGNRMTLVVIAAGMTAEDGYDLMRDIIRKQ